jgi:GNAT superfamily N-acetyltransferase
MIAVNGISVQRAAVEDAGVLTKTCKESFDSDKEVGAPGPGGPPGYDSVEWNLGVITNRYLQYYKILNQRDIVGGLIVGDRGPGYQVCERIWVDPDHMKLGIGSTAFQLAWQMYPNADLWALGTPKWNARTNPFYKKLGFVQIGTTHEYTWAGNYYEKRLTSGFPRAMSKVENLKAGQQRVVVEGRVDKISGTRGVESRKTHEELRVADAVVSDDTGSVKLTLWNEQIGQVTANSSIRIEEGYVKEFRGEVQLGVGKWGQVITLI